MKKIYFIMFLTTFWMVLNSTVSTSAFWYSPITEVEFEENQLALEGDVGDESHFYSFTVPANGVVSLHSEQLGSDLEFILYKDFNTRSIQSSSMKKGEIGSTQHISEMGISAGKYTAQVRQKTSGEPGEYKVNLVFMERNNFEIEPNKYSNEATLIPVNQKVDAWFGEWDFDTFKFELDTPGEVTVSMTSSPNNRYRISLGKMEQEGIDYAITTFSSVQQMNHYFKSGLGSGTYIVSIYGYETSANEGYSLQVGFKENHNIEREPNDSANGRVDNGTPLALNQMMDATFKDFSDTDYYRFEVKQKGQYHLRLSQSAKATYQLKLYTEDFNLLRTKRTERTNQETSTFLSEQLEPGIYYLQLDLMEEDVKYEQYQVQVTSAVYSDFSSAHWAFKEVTFLSENNIVGGFPNGTFQPARPTTRAEAAKMLSIALGFDKGSKPVHYSDISTTHWAYDYIVGATNFGLFKGNPDGNFYPNRNLTRAEMAEVLSRAYQLRAKKPAPFKDVAINHWANSSIAAVYEKKLTTGYPDQTFRPAQSTSRAEFSIFLSRAINPEFR